MAEEQKSSDEKSKSTIGLMIASGCMLLVVAMSNNNGPLQWLLYGAAIVTLMYAVFITAKMRKRKGTNSE